MSLRGSRGALAVVLVTLAAVVAAPAVGVATGTGYGHDSGYAPSSGAAPAAPAVVGAGPSTGSTAAGAIDADEGGPGGTAQVSTAATTLSSCRDITSAGVYELAGDLTNTTGGDCLVVEADDVTVDGNGFTITGGGSDGGVVVASTLANNTTVRDLTVRDVATGVALADNGTVRNVTARNVTTGISMDGQTPVVRNVSVVTVEGPAPGTTGVELGVSADGFRVADVDVTTRATGSRGFGVDVTFPDDGTITDVSAEAAARNVTVGVRVAGSNVTVERVSLDGYSIGLFSNQRNFTVRDGRVRSATVGTLLAGGPDATVENLSVGPVDGRVETDRVSYPAGYVSLNRSDGTVRNLTTPNATVSRVTGTNVSLRPVGSTPAGPRPVAVGRVNLSGAGGPPSATVGLRYDQRGLVESSVAAYRLGPTGTGPDAWGSPVGATVDTAADEIAVTTSSGGTYGAFANDSLARCTRITSPGVYELTGDLSTDGDSCIGIASPNVTVEGNGHAIVGNGTTYGVENVAFAANATVRNLTVRNVTNGVFLNDPDPTVRNVTATAVETGVDVAGGDGALVGDVRVETVEQAANPTVGVEARTADPVRVRNATVDLRATGSQATGIGFFATGNATVSNTTVTATAGRVTAGVTAREASNASVSGLAIDNTSYGVLAAGGTGVDVRSSRIENATVALGYDGFGGGADGTVESGAVENVTVGPVDGSITISGDTERARYLVADGSNNLTVSNLTTPEATLRSLTGANVSLAPVEATPATPAPATDVTIGRVNLTARGGAPTARVGFGYDERGLAEASTDVLRAGAAGWTSLSPGDTVVRDPANDTVVLESTSGEAGTYGAFANDTVLSSCTRIEGAGVYTLGGDLTGATANGETCLEVNTSDVVVDGGGYTFAGDGSGAAVAAVDANATNITVRNLTLRDWTSGVDSAGADDVTVRGVTARELSTVVEFDDTVGGQVSDVTGTGIVVQVVSLQASRDVRVADVDVGTRGGQAVDTTFGGANVTLRNLTARDTAGTANSGVELGPIDGVDADDVTLDGYGVGLDASTVSGLDVRDLTVRNATVVASVAGVPGRFDATQTKPTETGTIANVSVGNVTGTVTRDGRTTPAAYLRFDGSNDVTVSNLTTPNATFDRVTGANVTVAPVRTNDTPPRPVTIGTANVTRIAGGESPAASVGFGYDPGGVNESTVGLYDLGGAGWTTVPTGESTVDTATDTATVEVSEAGTYGAFAESAGTGGDGGGTGGGDDGGNATDVATCTRIESAGVYRLTTGLTVQGTCIEVNASDVVVDGDGHTITATEAAVATVRDGLANVTVRNLTVEGAAVDLARTRNATVRDLRLLDADLSLVAADGPRVVTLTTAEPFDSTEANTSIVADGVSGGDFRFVSLRTTADPAVSLVGATDTTLEDVSVDDATGPNDEGGLITGLRLDGADNVSLLGVGVRDAATGVVAPNATDLRVVSGGFPNLRDGGVGYKFVRPAGTRTGAVESATLVDPVTTSFDSGSVLQVDDTNDILVESVATRNATVEGFRGRNVTLSSVGTTPPAPSNVTVSQVNVTGTGPDATASGRLPYEEQTLNESTLAVYRVDRTNDTWVELDAAAGVAVDAANDTAVLSDVAPGTYGVFAEGRTIRDCRRIDEPGVYRLEGTLRPNGFTGAGCLTIAASNVTIDGQGFGFADGTGTAIGALPRAAVRDVTIRDVNVIDWDRGIQLTSTENVTLENVTVSARVWTLHLNDTANATLRNVVAEQRSDFQDLGTESVTAVDSGGLEVHGLVVKELFGNGYPTGLNLTGAADADLRDVTVRDGERAGVLATDTDTLTVENLTVDGFRDAETDPPLGEGVALGIAADGARNVTVRDATVANASTVLSATGDATVETGTVERLTVRSPPTGVGPSTYLRVDATNDLRVANLTTPEATVRAFDGTNATLVPVGATPPAPDGLAETVGRVNLTARAGAADATATASLAYDPTVVNESTVGLYRVDAGGGTDAWTELAAADGATVDRAADVATLTAVGPATYGAFGATAAGVGDGNGTDGGNATGVVEIDACTRVESAGVYRLTGDLSASPGADRCLGINASDVVLDGAGHTITGTLDRPGGTGTSAGVLTVGARSYANVTVRNLTVAEAETGVDLGGPASVGTDTPSRNLTVRNVTATRVSEGVTLSAVVDPTVRDVVATVTSPTDDTAGVDLGATDGARASDVTVRRVGANADLAAGVNLSSAENALVRDVTATEDSPNLTVGIEAGSATNVTIERTTVFGYDLGIAGDDASRLTVRDSSVRNATLAVPLSNGLSGESRVDAATVSNVEIGPVSGSVTLPASGRLPASYVQVDAVNDVQLTAVTTPEATVGTFDGSNVTLAPVGATPPAPAGTNRTVAAVNVTAFDGGTTATANLSLPYDGEAVDESTVGVYRLDEQTGSWTRLSSDVVVRTTTDTAVLSGVGPGTYGVFAANGTDGNATGPLGERLFPDGLPGGAPSSGVPTDTNGDGLLEDLDGDGQFQFVDVIEFVFAIETLQSADLTDAQVAALDFDGDDRVTFVDVIDLVFRV
jgi:hypothetical protein